MNVLYNKTQYSPTQMNKLYTGIIIVSTEYNIHTGYPDRCSGYKNFNREVVFHETTTDCESWILLKHSTYYLITYIY